MIIGPILYVPLSVFFDIKHEISAKCLKVFATSCLNAIMVFSVCVDSFGGPAFDAFLALYKAFLTYTVLVA